MFPQASTGVSVEVGDTQTAFPNLDRQRLTGIATRVLLAQGIDRAEVSIAIVDDPTIHEVNRRHLAHDCPTDVISFVLSDPGHDMLSGELVVSAETAVRMALRDGVEPWTELVLYVIHGLLHLSGLDDLTEPGAAAMRRREALLLEAEGLSHPFSTSGPGTEVGANAPRWERATWPS